MLKLKNFFFFANIEMKGGFGGPKMAKKRWDYLVSTGDRRFPAPSGFFGVFFLVVGGPDLNLWFLDNAVTKDGPSDTRRKSAREAPFWPARLRPLLCY